jgi:large subunit ribosomal protein L30
MSAKKAEQTADELVAAAVGRTPVKAAKTKQTAAKTQEEKTQEAKKTIRIRQVRSGIGCPIEMRETLRALGLGKMNRVAERKDTPEIRGMIRKIPHLVEVVD